MKSLEGKDTQQFTKIMQNGIYLNIYCALRDMGADKETIKAAEVYKDAPLNVLLEGIQWVQAWQQARGIEMITEAYLHSKEQIKEQQQADLLKAHPEKKLLN